MLDDPAVDVVHLTTPEPPAPRAGRGGARGRQARRLREAAGDGLGRDRRTARLGRASPGSSTPSTSTSASTRRCQRRAARRRPARSGGAADQRRLHAGLAAARDTDWNWRLDPPKGGGLRAVGDIGSHWLDLVRFVTGSRVEAVMADLTTFIPVRKQPSGPGGDIRGGSDRRDGRHADGDRGRRRDLAAAQGGARAVVDRVADLGGPQEPVELGDRRFRPTPWRGTPRIPSGCGSATGTGRTS